MSTYNPISVICLNVINITSKNAQVNALKDLYNYRSYNYNEFNKINRMIYRNESLFVQLEFKKQPIILVGT